MSPDPQAQPAPASPRAEPAPDPAPGSGVTEAGWQALRGLTNARIALGRSGVSLPTQAQLQFQLAHAMARDAVHLTLDALALQQALDALAPEASPSVGLHSAAPDRRTYLQRPDLGRRLSPSSREALQRHPQAAPDQRPYDLAVVVADGLSALAIAQHSVPLLARLLPALADEGWRLAPLSVVSQGRVAVADEIGELWGARLVVILIGERPGLSSPDSMGLYLSWMPRVGLTDAQRNCISNVRPAGLPPEAAARKLHHLLGQARLRQLSGVGLKDDTEPDGALRLGLGTANFLLPKA